MITSPTLVPASANCTGSLGSTGLCCIPWPVLPCKQTKLHRHHCICPQPALYSASQAFPWVVLAFGSGVTSCTCGWPHVATPGWAETEPWVEKLAVRVGGGGEQEIPSGPCVYLWGGETWWPEHETRHLNTKHTRTVPPPPLIVRRCPVHPDRCTAAVQPGRLPKARLHLRST